MDKKAFFEERLRTGSAFLHIDARRPGVRVPDAYAEDPHLVLQYGYALKIPIPDLAVSDWGVRATLSFSRRPVATAIPWSAVYAIHGDDSQALVWREDMPSDLPRETPASSVPMPAPAPAHAHAPAPAAKAAAPAPSRTGGGKRRHLKLVD